MGKKILIVGGVAGGASFAARMRRLDENAEIIMFEKGEFVSFANCGLPYHVDGTIKERKKLILQTPESFRDRYKVEVRLRSEVISVNAAGKQVTVKSAQGEYSEGYDILLLSPGCVPIVPPVKGVGSSRVFTLRNIPDMDRIKAFAERPDVKHAVVIGGGFIGLEMTESLKHAGLEVTQVELLDQVFAPADLEMAEILHEHIRSKGVSLILSDGAAEFAESGNGLRISLNSGKSLECDMVIMAVGVRPDTGFLKDSGIEMNPRGALITDSHMRTNMDGVYAVGDAVEVTDLVTGARVQVPLAGPANRQGRIAADNAAGIASEYKSTQGTAICKVFDLAAAVTGLSEKSAVRNNIPFIKTYSHSGSHAGYYPGAEQMSIKALFSPRDGRLLGAQVIGKDGVDKRIDVLAVAVRHQLTADDLTELELAYAPPYGSAKDPVNMAGFIAQNILAGRMAAFYPEDALTFNPLTQVLLDVRDKTEVRKGAIAGNLHIPVNELRGRLGELDREKEILVYCQVGFRGYLAERILAAAGFRARNMSGGYQTWSSGKYDDRKRS